MDQNYEAAARHLLALSNRYHDASLSHPEQREVLETIAQHFTLAANALLGSPLPLPWLLDPVEAS